MNFEVLHFVLNHITTKCSKSIEFDTISLVYIEISHHDVLSKSAPLHCATWSNETKLLLKELTTYEFLCKNNLLSDNIHFSQLTLLRWCQYKQISQEIENCTCANIHIT